VEIKNPNEIDEIYDGISYSKGASLNGMCYDFLGHDVRWVFAFYPAARRAATAEGRRGKKLMRVPGACTRLRVKSDSQFGHF